METEEEKEIDKELDDIIGEMPIEEKKQKIREKRQQLHEPIGPEKPSKGPIDYIKSKRKGIIIVIAVIALLLIGTLLFGPLTCDGQQDSNKTCDSGDQISFSTIKQQIITKGYAEIGGEGVTMKVSPYTG